MTKIILKSGKDEAVRRFHPWIFSGAIKKIHGEPFEGEIVEVYSNHNELLGIGHYQIGSIAVRIFSFVDEVIDYKFWKNKIKEAYDFRLSCGIINNIEFNAYRLVYGEGDGMPGLIIDYYNGAAVIQAHSIGWHLIKNEIAEILKEIYGNSLKSVYYKSSETLPKQAKLELKDEYLWGESSSVIIEEYGCKYNIDWETGQKTGFFIDQRENRNLLATLCKGKKVLNTFCYSGGFSVAALKAGASVVHSVDSSKKAIELTEKNLILNGFDTNINKCITSDTLNYLNNTEEVYDIIILDPPAYAKHNDVKHNAVQGYKRLNTSAIEKIGTNGILFTFSCSQVVERYLFNSTVISAAINVKRNCRILYQLSQPPDHPVSAFHPEGQYLKGLVLFIN